MDRWSDSEFFASVTVDDRHHYSEARFRSWELGVGAARAASMAGMRMSFSDKNWVGIGLNWVKLGSFSFFKKAKNEELVNVYKVICVF